MPVFYQAHYVCSAQPKVKTQAKADSRALSDSIALLCSFPQKHIHIDIHGLQEAFMLEG